VPLPWQLGVFVQQKLCTEAFSHDAETHAVQAIQVNGFLNTAALSSYIMNLVKGLQLVKNNLSLSTFIF
jgi:hypothetical protein